MTREEAMIRVKRYLTSYLPLEDSGEIDEIMEALEQEPRWIPVSERLPKKGKEVLVSVYDTYNKKVIISRYQGEQYGFTCGLVSAWMPLPKPYKAESEE